VPAAYAHSIWIKSIQGITHITDEEFNIFSVLVQPSGAIPKDQIETDDDACGVNEVTKMEVMVIFKESVAFQPPFVYRNPL
jgi:hypothetical protein